MKSIRWKLVFIYLALVFIVMIISGTFIVIRIDAQETKNAEDELKQCAAYVYEQIIQEYDNPDDFQSGIANLFIMRSSIRNIQASIINSQGKTIASSVFSDSSLFIDYKNSVVISALSGNESFDTNKKYVDFNSQVKDWISYGYPVFNELGEVEYVIYVQMDGESIKTSLFQTANTIMFAVFLALFLTGILGIIFANTITEPIALLRKKANELAKGGEVVNIPVKSDDEIGQLTSSFNYMARELKKTVSELKNENNKLEIVMHNMTDGVLAFDENGKLLHANSVFYDMLGKSSDEKITLSEFLKETNMKNIVLSVDVIIETIIKRSTKYISVSFIPYGTIGDTTKNIDDFSEYSNKNDKVDNNFNYSTEKSVKGVVVVLQDITKHKQLDNMRKEFVANVSHEIRTPLTTIKSYTETLLDGAVDDKETAIEFLQIIDFAADRVAVLSKDLLELSHLDNKQMKFNLEKVNLVNLVRDCVKQNVIAAKNKNQSIYFNEPENEEMNVIVDIGRINQVINNIISNSMKYSGENSEIIISASEKTNCFEVNISDNGIGIPKEDIDHIFERFYRVDKARSRAMGGNGLGLSIAKEIMEDHGGKIFVKSEVGKGTCMTLVFPKKNKR